MAGVLVLSCALLQVVAQGERSVQRHRPLGQTRVLELARCPADWETLYQNQGADSSTIPPEYSDPWGA
jgi:hypothetical protein